jgi:hypothetical protein
MFRKKQKKSAARSSLDNNTKQPFTFDSDTTKNVLRKFVILLTNAKPTERTSFLLEWLRYYPLLSLWCCMK